MGIEGELIEPFAVAEVYCDGFEHTVINGMMMATGYRVMPPCRPNGDPQRVAVVRFVIKVENVVNAINDAKQAMSAPFIPRERRQIGRH